MADTSSSPHFSPEHDSIKTKEELQAEIAALHERIANISSEVKTMELDRSLFRTLMDNLPDRIYFKDLESKFTRVNHALATMHLHENPDQMIGKSDADLFSTEHAEQAFSDEKKILETEEAIVGFLEKETWEERPEAWVSTTKMPLYDREANLIGTFGISRDVTELKKAQDALRDSENLYHSLVENLVQGICRKDLESRYTFCNDQFCKMLGKSKEELIGKTTHDLFPEREADSFKSDDELVLGKGETYEAFDEYVTPDGRSLFLHVVKTPVRDAEGKIVGLQGVFWDVTQKRRAEEAMVLLGAIVQSSEDAIVGTDLNGTILSWNRGAEQIYGYSSDEVIGKDINFLVPASKEYEIEPLLERIQQGESITQFETKRVTKSGGSVYVSLNISPIQNANNQTIGIATIARDITERKQSEEALYQLAAIVESSNEAILGLNLDGMITSWNPAATRTYGFTAEEMKGESIRRLVALEQHDDIFMILGQAARGARLSHYQTTHVDKHGQPKKVSLTVSPIIHSGSEKVSGVSMIVHQGTDVK